ncbi:OLC1v1004913C1 [Oldenlandia corymbosa var. corymbosa]|uniref:OLC1v1004913C1 n=1 Tax=Oldenlandia corymbosa var. corymbosa TaxID=529605 RepID=A0AAV1DDH0_OLDCO|nr:OLC1v1004913C1 [Oldenlandia corymbosa var. corymbosa]
MEREKQLGILYQKQGRATQFPSKAARDEWLQNEILEYDRVLASNLTHERKLKDEISPLKKDLEVQDDYLSGRKNEAAASKTRIDGYGDVLREFKEKRDKLHSARKSFWKKKAELSSEIKQLQSEVVKAEKSLDHATPGVRYSFDAGHNSSFESEYMTPRMSSCLERIDKLLDDMEKKNASYFSQEDCYHSNASVYQPPPTQPTLRELAARQPTLRELAARQPTLRELAALQSSPCQPTFRQLGSSYHQPPTQPQLTVREAALRDFQSEKGQQLIKEVNQYRLSVGLPEYNPIGNLLKLNKNEKIFEDDSLVQSPQPLFQTELECEEVEETKEINSQDNPSSPDSSGIYIVVKHNSLILRVGDKNVDQVDFDENNIPIVSKEGFEVDTCGEVVPSIRDFEDDVKDGSMKDQEEDQWYKIEFEKEDIVV